MNQNTMRQRAENYLRWNTDQNINLLAALHDGIAEVAVAEEKGCLLCTGGEIWQIAAADTETALRFYERIPAGTTMLEVQDVAQIEPVAARFRPRCIETYYNVWYDRPDMAVDADALPYEVRTLSPEEAGQLACYYHLPGPDAGKLEETAAYLRSRADGSLFALYDGAALLGFAGTHDEGSMGLLTVLPAYRRRGLGSVLERLSIARALERGHLPFAQVAQGNEASLALQRSLGMRVAAERVCWMDK